MKRGIAFFVILCLLCAALAGCGAHEIRGGAVPSIVATVFPVYDWTRNLLGDNPGNLRLTLLLDSGVDMHSFQPTVEDLAAISTCDLFLYVGGESDAWIADALAEAANGNMVTVNLLEVLGDGAVLEEDAEDEDEYDEHVWLSLRNAALFTEAIADALAAVDPANGPFYAANAAAYTEALAALDARYAAAVNAAARDTLLFADRFPFRYLAEDYQLACWAAFPGCEAETEASFETLSLLIRTVDALELPCILTTESPVRRFAETVAENAKSAPKILALDSMQAVDAAEIRNGATYLGVMEQNLETLKEALR